MIRVLISDKGDVSAHSWWYNFIKNANSGNSLMQTDERIDLINVELMNWSAQLWQNEPMTPEDVNVAYKNAYLDFYDDHAYHWFVLRWS